LIVTLKRIASTLALLATGTVATAQQKIDLTNWGSVTAPVFGTSEKGVYSAAELFAGPNKFGSYYAGVLPNGRIVKPAGTSIQIGMNPLGSALTPDGKFLVTSNDDERQNNIASLQSTVNLGGYSLSVIDTASMKVVSQIELASGTGNFFIGLQITGTGPYTVFASGGGDNDIKLFSITSAGVISQSTPANIVITPILGSTDGYVSNYSPDAALNTADASGFKSPAPSQINRTAGAQITFPAGSALSPDGKYLYVACNGDNSLAVIDTTTLKVIRRVPVGYFPYGVSVNSAGNEILVSNWGVEEYKFVNPIYDPATGKLVSVGTAGPNYPDGFYLPQTDVVGRHPKTSSVSIISAAGGNGAMAVNLGAYFEGKLLDSLYQVGDTHPSASAIVKQGGLEVFYVTKSNSDALGIIRLDTNAQVPDFDLSLNLSLNDGHQIHGTYPNAIAVSPDQTRMYVAEAGINSIAVLDVTVPLAPKLLGRIGTGWYPTSVTVSPDNKTLYVTNAKGIGEDINPATDPTASTPAPTGIASFNSNQDSNFMFGSAQKIDLTSITLDNTTVISNNFAVNTPTDTSVVPVGGAPSPRIKHVFFIEHENKSFDSMLGNQGAKFGPFASMTFNDATGKPYTNQQFTGVSLNTQKLATTFAVGANFYSDSEESDAGHQFVASGTATDYTEKTLLVKSNRGLLVNKNFEPEDYPEGGYIFNNAARNGVTFKDYGELVRIMGTDTGTNTPTTIDDPTSGNMGLPKLMTDNATVVTPIINNGDTTSPTQGLGQQYFMAMPMLAILGQPNPTGEARIDLNYPGYNFNISDQRRAQEFIKDFDRMSAAGTIPQLMYIYQPNDHTGGVQAPNQASVINTGAATIPNYGAGPMGLIADGDVGLGMVINHIMSSPIYYDAATNTGSAIFVTWDDAQTTVDHIHPHRNIVLVISPFAKPGYMSTKHYSSASIVKTEELLLGLPPNNLGDLLATDLRDMFQPTYNNITAAQVPVTVTAKYEQSNEGKKIWAFVNKLDVASGPDRDSMRLGELTRLSIAADDLHKSAETNHKLKSRSYRKEQKKLLDQAERLVNGPKPRDTDGD